MAMLFSGFLAELLGGVTTDYLLRRTRSLQIARSLMIAVSWVLAVAGLAPAIIVHDLVVGLGRGRDRHCKQSHETGEPEKPAKLHEFSPRSEAADDLPRLDRVFAPPAAVS